MNPRLMVVHLVPKLIAIMFCAQAALQLNDINGVRRKPLELHDQKAAVFIFVGTECPISNSYAPEINRMIQGYKDKGLDFYVVYSEAKLSGDDAKKHAKAFGFTCPALMDSQQKLMKKTGVTVTPEAAVMDAHGQVLYLGRIDNWYEDFGKQRYKPTTQDLIDALDEILVGKKVATPVTKAVGCPV